MGRSERGMYDWDMTDLFVQWMVEFAPSTVFSIDDENGREFARRNRELAWLESTYEQGFLLPLAGLDDWALEKQLEHGTRWVNSRIYKCEIPFEKLESSSREWVLVGDFFACENCQPEPGEDGAEGCSSCAGEGWAWMTVYDDDVREELEESCQENEVSLPSAFPLLPRTFPKAQADQQPKPSSNSD